MIAVADADSGLVLRCQSNDLAAFNEIVARYQDKVLNYISRMVGPAADAEDLAQETFVRAYANIGLFQSRSSLQTWLFRIATNLCIDHARRAAKRRFLLRSLKRDGSETSEEVIAEVPDTRLGPEPLLLNQEFGEVLNRALAELPAKLRTVILLFDVEGLPYEEIAQIAGCPLGTVKSRLFNARAALRQKLAPYLNATMYTGQ